MRWLALVLLLAGCAPTTRGVACAGPQPITCRCVRSCSFDGFPSVDLDWQCLPVCWRRDAR